MSHAELVVMKLMENHLNVCHELYVYNYYASVPLAKKLLERQTACVERCEETESFCLTLLYNCNS